MGTFVTTLELAALLTAMEFWVGRQDGEKADQVHTVRRALETETASAASSISRQELEEARLVLQWAEEAINAPPIDHSAAMQCDIELHRLIAEASRNPCADRPHRNSLNQDHPGRMWRSLHDNEELMATHREHLGILDALRKHDAE